jgi:hypothetical protein
MNGSRIANGCPASPQDNINTEMAWRSKREAIEGNSRAVMQLIALQHDSPLPHAPRKPPFAHFHLFWPVSGLASTTIPPSHARRTVAVKKWLSL